MLVIKEVVGWHPRCAGPAEGGLPGDKLTWR